MAVTVDRRSFLLGAGSAAVLAACGGSGSPLGTGADASGDELFASRFAAPFTIIADGTDQRIPLGIADATGPLSVASMPSRVVAAISLDGELVAPRQDVFLRGEGIPFPYYPIRTAFDEEGIFDVELSWNQGVVTTVIQVHTPDESPLLQPGDAMPPVETPTYDAPGSVDPICTFATPCDFHDVSLSDALTENRPIVLVVSTPGFCQTQICGPLLSLAIDDHAVRPDAYRLLHAEVYRNPSLLPDTEPTGIMLATGMAVAGFEPSVFFLDPDGGVNERIDNVCDATELAEAIDRLVV